MKIYITIDGGTTNTRISLVKDNEILATDKYQIGARASIGDNSALKQTIKDGIKAILEKTGYNESDVISVLASGMITSEYGLVKLDHITLPCSIKELKENMYYTSIPEITYIPFAFVRGVKSVGKTLENSDVMRGEEAELMGIMQEGTSCAYVLPGSHSKIIFTDEKGVITSFSTLLTGELIYAVASSTILKDGVNLKETEIDYDYLKKGKDYCVEYGINEAFFKVRVLKNLFGATPKQCYSFFLGVAIAQEIERIIKANPPPVVIGGKKQLKEATAYLLKESAQSNVVALTDTQVDASSTLGVIKIYEYKA